MQKRCRNSKVSRFQNSKVLNSQKTSSRSQQQLDTCIFQYFQDGRSSCFQKSYFSKPICYCSCMFYSYQSVATYRGSPGVSWIICPGSSVLGYVYWIAYPGSPVLVHLSWVISLGLPVLGRLSWNRPSDPYLCSGSTTRRQYNFGINEQKTNKNSPD